jgi:hypothetical protein
MSRKNRNIENIKKVGVNVRGCGSIVTRLEKTYVTCRKESTVRTHLIAQKNVINTIRQYVNHSLS